MVMDIDPCGAGAMETPPRELQGHHNPADVATRNAGGGVREAQIAISVRHGEVANHEKDVLLSRLPRLLYCCFSEHKRSGAAAHRLGASAEPDHHPWWPSSVNRIRILSRRWGKSYRYEPLRFQGSTPQIQALAAGELEIAAFGPSALALAVLNAHLDLRIIADVMQDGGKISSRPGGVRKGRADQKLRRYERPYRCR